MPGTHVVGLAKDRSRLVEGVEVRGDQSTFICAPHFARSDGVDGLIIGDDEDNVWFGWSRVQRKTESEQDECVTQESEKHNKSLAFIEKHDKKI